MNSNEDEFTNRPTLVRKRARSILWTRVGVALLVLYMVFTSTLISVAALNGTQQRDLIVDCTVSTGDCYKEQTQRTAEAVEKISDQGNRREATTRMYIIATAACEQELDNPTIDALTKCVERKVK